jgi:hypothetical protein
MSAARRRSKRISKSERVMLDITDPTPVQDIVVTLEVSANGAKVLARRHMDKEARGTAMFISAGRKVPCRIAWQRQPGPDGRMETGLEIYSNGNFWGLDLTGSEVDPEAPRPLPAALRASGVTPAGGLKVPAATPPKAVVASPGSKPAAPPAAAKGGTMQAMLEALGKNRSASLPIELWCMLVDNLEAKGVFSRAELIAMLKKIGQG